MPGLYLEKARWSLDAPIGALLLWYVSHFQPCELLLCESHMAKGQGEEGCPTWGIALLQDPAAQRLPVARPGMWGPH